MRYEVHFIADVDDETKNERIRTEDYAEACRWARERAEWGMYDTIFVHNTENNHMRYYLVNGKKAG